MSMIETSDYYRRREREERDRMARSSDDQVRRIHQQLADEYAGRIVQMGRGAVEGDCA